MKQYATGGNLCYLDAKLVIISFPPEFGRKISNLVLVFVFD